jgi:SNF2-related domain
VSLLSRGGVEPWSVSTSPYSRGLIRSQRNLDKSDVRVLILDEAQEAKTPNTKISHALKSMSPRFRIACTGTPVETRLLDAWNLLDFLQPGVLGSANEFVNRFERPLMNDPQTAAYVVQGLREQLKFGKQNAFVIRRSKEEVLKGLPRKHEHVLSCMLSDDERAWHVSLVADVKRVGGAHAAEMVSLPGPTSTVWPARHGRPSGGIGPHLGRVDLREVVRCDRGVHQGRATHVVRAFANRSG